MTNGNYFAILSPSAHQNYFLSLIEQDERLTDDERRPSNDSIVRSNFIY